MMICNTCGTHGDFGLRKFRGEMIPKKSCLACSEKHRKSQLRWRNTPEGRESHLDSLKRYRDTDGFADAVARYESTEKNATKQKRANQKIMQDPGKKMMKLMLNKLSDVLSARRTDYSETLSKYLEFTDKDDAVNHFTSFFPTGSGWSMDNYGSSWEVDHRIPRKWYNHNDDDDVRRSWKKANLRPMAPKENNKKRIEIPDDATLHAIGKDCWPKSWNGVPPTAEERVAMYRLHHDMRMGRIARV